MLKLKNINKIYHVNDFKVHALNDFSVNFRKNEFVAVLGPSGSGKTTLLNLVGGLDTYTSGNLIINGIETKNFKEKDWNVYRSHRVGFVFQSYNLIPHQSVLSNVELALTIAGVSKEERIKRAKEALDKVGLSDQYYKKPNQLSGGQSQRVAIARALVNDPEILLADEPTGALDSETGYQIMALIKEIAKDRLVIMVTHDGELANKYANRIIALRDGKLISDSNHFEGLKEKEVVKEEKKEHAKMSFFTSFKLSLQNLWSKKSRTILTAIASAIGIIGISLVLSVSTGVQTFITKTQEDLLSGNPITISESTIDMEAMMSSMTLEERTEVIKEINKVGIDQVVKMLAERSQATDNLFVQNNITQEYIDFLKEMPAEHIAEITYNREIDLSHNLYTDLIEEDGSQTNLSIHGLRNIITAILEHDEETKAYASLISSFTNVINEAPTNINYLANQYDLLGSSKFAENKNELMLVLNQNDLISDLTLAQLGFYTQSEFQNVIFDALESENFDEDIPIKTHIDYSEILGRKFMWHSNDAIFTKSNDPVTVFTYNAYGEDVDVLDNAIELEIVGILQLKEGIEYGTLQSGLYYTNDLTNYVVDTNLESEAVTYLNDNDLDSFESMIYPSQDENPIYVGITFDFEYQYLGSTYNGVGFAGQSDPMSDMLSSIIPGGLKTYVLSKRDLGGEELPSLISIYALDLNHKDDVINYLDTWNTSS